MLLPNSQIVPLIFILFLFIYVYGLVEETLDLSSSPSSKSSLVDLESTEDGGEEMENAADQTGLFNSLITWLTTTSLLSNSRLIFGNTDGSGGSNNAGDLYVSSSSSSIPSDDCQAFDRTFSVWAWSTAASILVALTGVVPAIFICTTKKSDQTHRKEDGERTLNRLLSFAVGSLLGDVFLHILPETWRYASDGNDSSRHWGMWVILGSVLCFLVEKCASNAEDSKHKAAAFVNLCANAIDNFTHGLAVGASFSVSIRFGLLTTFAILIHEIPHEISDFAILLRADFDRWSAVKAQMVTATGGLLGASVALMSNGGAVGLERRTACWILPFTAGGFLNVALVQVLPDLLKEKSLTESAMQLMYILTGVGLMGLISCMHV